MRFRKTLSICKGVKLNLSKSGVSCTVGGKGLSLNLGKSGVFLNTSIPGTGLYDRKKLIGGKKSSKDKKKEVALPSAPSIDVTDYALFLEENGEIAVVRRDGSRLSESEERALRKTDWYDDESDKLMDEFREAMEAETDAFVSLYKKAVKVSEAGAVEPEEAVEARIGEWVSGLELPVEFDVEYEYDVSNGSVMLDLDLPEIDDLPEEKVVELASGALRTKDKTQKELREEYRTCVLGLGVYFASHVFEVSAGIGAVLVSAYTQRRDRKSGEQENCYIYSIAFEREDFLTDRCANEDPADFCDRFRSRINVLASGEMKEIVPYTADEFAEMLE